MAADGSTGSDQIVSDAPVIHGSKITFKTARVVPFLTCSLCAGLFREATTISECLHTFCRGCLSEHLRKCDQHKQDCPSCGIMLGMGNNTKDKLMFDRTIQSIVDNLFPDIVMADAAKKASFLAGVVDRMRREAPTDAAVTQVDEKKASKTSSGPPSRTSSPPPSSSASASASSSNKGTSSRRGGRSGTIAGVKRSRLEITSGSEDGATSPSPAPVTTTTVTTAAANMTASSAPSVRGSTQMSESLASATSSTHNDSLSDESSTTVRSRDSPPRQRRKGNNGLASTQGVSRGEEATSRASEEKAADKGGVGVRAMVRRSGRGSGTVAINVVSYTITHDGETRSNVVHRAGTTCTVREILYAIIHSADYTVFVDGSQVDLNTILGSLAEAAGDSLVHMVVKRNSAH